MKEVWKTKEAAGRTTGMHHSLWQRILSVLLCFVLLGGIIGPAMTNARAVNNKQATIVADPSTMYSWAGSNYIQNTRNVGRVWTDKSVLKEDSITLSSPIGQDTGDTITKTQGAEFMVALSALSSTSTETTMTGKPLDIVLLLDVSGSMNDDLTAYTPVYNPSTNEDYYVLVGTEYQTVSYHTPGWRYGWWNYTYVTPKTSEQDNTPDSVQFYAKQTKMQALQAAATSFVQATAAMNEGIADPANQHQIALVKFAGSESTSIGNDRENNSSAYNYTQIVSNLTTNLTDAPIGQKSVSDWISELVASGGTRVHYGMNKAEAAFESARSNAKKVLILFTDGEPNNGSGFSPSVAAQAVNQANAMKAGTNGDASSGTLIYTIGVLSGADVTDLPTNTTQRVNIDDQINYYLHGVSSNFPDATATTSGSTRYVTLGARAENSDYYKVATDAHELNEIFISIFDEISSDLASPTLVDSGEYALTGGYVTFTDKLGPYMELKGFNGLVYKGRKVGSIPGVVSSQQTQSYSFTGMIEKPNPLVEEATVSLENILITVEPGATPAEGQTITVKIPAGMLPLRYYDVDTGNADQAEDAVRVTISDAYPMRLFYSVGLRDDVKSAIQSGRYDTVAGLETYVQQNTDSQGKVHFYSNNWDRPEGSRQENAQWGQGGTTSAFVPALSNNFYYHVDNTPLYVLNGNTYEYLTTPPQNGQTYYYQYTHYGIDEKNPNQSEIRGYVNFVFDSSASYNSHVLPHYAAGSTTEVEYYYIQGGTAKIKLSNAANFRDAKTSNDTDTADYALWPSWQPDATVSGRIESVNYMGNNGRISYDASGALQISKTVSVPEGSGLTAPDADFTFRITGLSAGTYATVLTDNGTSPVVKVAGELTVGSTGATVTLKADQVLTVYGLPVSDPYEVEETNLAAGFTQTAPANGDSAAGSIAAGATAVAAFANRYSVTAVSVANAQFPKVIKRVYDANRTQIPLDQWEEDWQFTFVLSSASDSEPMPFDGNGDPVTQLEITIDKNSPSAAQYGSLYSNGRTAAFDLTDIVFDKVGTYTYYISEKHDNLTGMNYTPAQYKLVVEVTDNGQGALESTEYLYIYMDDTGAIINDNTVEEYAVFHNLYDLDNQTVDFKVYKQYDDLSGGLPSDNFVFTVTAIGPNASTAPLPAGGTALTGSGVYGKTATVTGTDLVPFGVVTYTGDHVGETFTYEVREVAGNRVGMQYDPAVYTITVVVESQKVNGSTKSVVTTSVSWLKDGQPYTPTEYEPTYFENTYAPQDAGASLQVYKTLNGRPWKAGDSFAFTLTPVTVSGVTPPMPASATTAVTYTSSGTGAVRSNVFGTISYDKTGVYRYVISENAGTIGGVEYSVSRVDVTVTVTLNKSTGNLEASVSYSGSASDGAAFTNTYTPEEVTMTPEAILVEKTLQGRDWSSSDRFNFTLIPGPGSPVPGNTSASILRKDAIAAFDGGTNALTFHSAGTYYYYVVELPGTVGGITYDRTAWRLAVEITDDQNGNLQVASKTWAKATLPVAQAQNLANLQALTYTTVSSADKASFINTYAAAPTAPLVLTGTKNLLGRDAKAGETFTFTLALSAGEVTGVTIPAGVETASIANAKVGSNPFRFGGDNAGIVFSKVGDYQFQIKETAGQDSDMYYSNHVATVYVTVTDPGNGKLLATVTNTDYVDDTTFINHYYTTEQAKDVQGAVSSPTINGQLVGVGDVLHYTIHWENIHDVPSSVVITDKIPAHTTFVEGSAGYTADAGITINPPTLKDGQLTWNIQDVPAHGKLTVSFSVTVDNTAGGEKLSNEAFINNVKTNEVVNYVPKKAVVNDTAASDGRTSVRVGDTLTFTIDYVNTADTAATITVTDLLDAGLTYVAQSAVGAEYTAATAADPAKLVWTIENVPAGATGSVTFKAIVNEKALTDETANQATVGNSATNKVSATNEVPIPKPETTTLHVGKKVISNTVTAPDSQFTFHLILKDAQGNVLTGSYAWKSHAGNTGTIISCDGNGNHSDGKGVLAMHKDGWYEITGLPVGATYEIVEFDIPAGFKQTGPVDGASQLITKGTLVADAAANRYEAVNTFTPATVSGFQVGKQVWTNDQIVENNNWNSSWVFAFHITGNESPAGVALPMPAKTQITINKQTAVNGGLRTANFGDIHFVQPGVYSYIITESRTFTSEIPRLPGIAYSQAAYQVTVTVTADANGVLIPSWKMTLLDGNDVVDDGNLTTALFKNIYELGVDTWVPAIKKEMSNSADAFDTNLPPFGFVIEALRGYKTDAPGTQAPAIPGFGSQNDQKVTGKTNAAGQVGLGAVEFDSSNVGYTYEYLVYEDETATSTYQSVAYDKTRYIVKIQVVEAPVAGTSDVAVYADVSYHLAKLDGLDWAIDEGAQAVNGLHFKNAYTPASANVVMNVQKILQGRKWLSGDSFTFKLTPAFSTYPMPAGKSELVTTVNKDSADHMGSFDAIEFTQVGEYGYFIQEVPGNAGGMTYDDDLYLVWIKITDTGAANGGKLVAQVDYYLSNAEKQPVSKLDTNYAPFTNVYTAASADLVGLDFEKVFTGRDWKRDDLFAFELKPEKDTYPMPVQATVTLNNASAHLALGSDSTLTKGSFGKITFTEAGTYVYTLTEIAGPIPGVSYDKTEYIVTITVTDNNNGQLVVGNPQFSKVGGSGTVDSLRFTNTYKAARISGVPIKVEKQLVGREWLAGEQYSFTLTPMNMLGTQTLSLIQLVGQAASYNPLHVTVTAESLTKIGTFGNLVFEKAGTYLYKITEDIPNVLAENMTYDAHTTVVRVVVEDLDHNGQLTATVHYCDEGHAVEDHVYTQKDNWAGAAVFKNVYFNPMEAKSVANEQGITLENGSAVSAGEILIYKINWAAIAPKDGSGTLSGKSTVTVVDTLPAGVTFLDGSTQVSGTNALIRAAHTTEGGVTKLTWTLEDIPIGTEGSITFQVKVTGLDTNGDKLENTAIVNGYTTNTTANYLPGKAVTAENLTTPQLGQTVTYTIRYWHPGALSTVKITDVLSSNLTFVSADNGGAVSAAAPNTVTWSIESSQAGWKYVSFRAYLNVGALTTKTLNDAQVHYGEGDHAYTVTTNSVEVPQIQKSSLQITKSVALKDGGLSLTDAKADKEFTFRVNLKDMAGNALTGSYSYTVDGVSVAQPLTPDSKGNVQLQLKHGQKAVINDLPIGTYYTVTEISIPNGYTSNKTDNAQSGALVSQTQGQVEFVNTYAVSSVSVILKANKILKGPDGTDLAKGHTFSFGVYESRTSATPILTDDCDSNGAVEFAELTFTKPTTVTYLIREISNSSALYTYDNTVYAVTVTVTDKEDGTLEAKTEYKILDGAAIDGIPTFTNTYHPGAEQLSVSIGAKKEFSGWENVPNWKSLVEGKFGFQLQDSRNKVVATAKNGADGKIVFDNVPVNTAAVNFTAEKVGTYTFTMKEIIPEDPAAKLSGVTYDPAVYTVVVTVVLDANTQKLRVADNGIAYYLGQGDSKTPIAAEDVVFTNKYAAAASDNVVLTASKVLVNRDLVDGEFTFQVLDSKGKVFASGKNDDSGAVTLDMGKFDTVGVYTYTVSEKKGEDEQLVYSSTTYKVTVTVTDDGSGKLTAVAAVEGGKSLVFTNYFTTPAKLTLTAEKTLTGKKLTDGEFTFEVRDENGQLLATGTNAADGTVTFEPIVFETAGDYTVYMTEVAKENAEGMTFDKTKHAVAVKVTATGTDCALVATLVKPEQKYTFANKYQPAPVDVSLEAEKLLKGRDLVNGEFSFTVTDAQGKVLSTGKNNAEGKILFAPISFSEPGSYKLLIQEDQGKVDGVTYDTAVFEAIVTVTAQDDGSLKTEISYTNGEPVFHNTFKTIPETGDDFDLMMWSLILLMSCCGLLFTALYGWRKRYL